MWSQCHQTMRRPPPEIAKEKLEVDSDNSDEPPDLVALALTRSLMKLLAQFDTPDAELYKEGYTRACLHEKAYELSKKHSRWMCATSGPTCGVSTTRLRKAKAES